MQQVLKAYKQDPDDWRIRYGYRPTRKPSLINRTITKVKAIFNSAFGVGLIFIIASSIGCLIAGMS